MRTLRLQNRITAGRSTLPAVVLISMACWLLAALVWPGRTGEADGASALWQLLDAGRLPLWASLTGGYLLSALAGWLLIVLNNTYAMIRMRASVQTSLYLLLVAACPPLHPLQAGHVAVLLCLLALFYLFGSYQQKNSSGPLFHAFLALGVASLALPKLTLLAPLFWIGAYSFRSLGRRSFCASLLGWGLPYWFLLGYAYVSGQIELFCQPFRQLAAFAPLQWTFQPRQLVVLGYLLVLYAVSTGHYLATSYEDKIRTRSYLLFLILLCFCLFVYIGFQPCDAGGLLPLLAAGISILAGHLFALTSSRGSNVFFVVMVVALFAIYGFGLG